MARKQQPYRQHLPALKLSIERLTPAVPNDGRWYVLHAGTEIGSYRSLGDAQARWAEIVAASDWQPSEHAIDPKAQLRAEAAERWARNRGG